MRQMISLLVAEVPPPYHIRQQKITHIFTADLTTDPLARALRSIFMLALENYKHQEQISKIKKLLSNLFSRFENVNKHAINSSTTLGT